MGLFGTKGSGAGGQSEAARGSRHSSGWVQLQKHLRSTESLRILDVGATSATNINFVTGLGHGIYMANLAEDAARPEYLSSNADGEAVYDTARFIQQNLDFAGRTFDVVLLWDTVDYMPEALVEPVIDRLYEVMEPGGQLLAFFHSKPGGDTAFRRFHLTEHDSLDTQRAGALTVQRTYSNRQVETLFHLYRGYKFFLAKDALREVIVTR